MKDARDWRQEDLTRQDLRQGYDAAREAMRLESAGGEFDPERIQEVGEAAFAPWISQYPDEAAALNAWVESVAASYVPSERARMGEVLEGARTNPWITEDPKLAQAEEMLRAAGLEETLLPGQVGPRKPPVDYISPDGIPQGRQFQPNMGRLLDVAEGQQRQDWYSKSVLGTSLQDQLRVFVRPDGTTAHVVELPDPNNPGHWEAYILPDGYELLNPQDIVQMMRRLPAGLGTSGVADALELEGDTRGAAVLRAMESAQVTDAEADTLAAPPGDDAPTTARDPAGAFPRVVQPEGSRGPIPPPGSGLTGNQGMGNLLYTRGPTGIDWGAGPPLPEAPPVEPVVSEPDTPDVTATLLEAVNDPTRPGSERIDIERRVPRDVPSDQFDPFSTEEYPFVRPGKRPMPGTAGGMGAGVPGEPEWQGTRRSDDEYLTREAVQNEIQDKLPEAVNELQQELAGVVAALKTPQSEDELNKLQDQQSALRQRLKTIKEAWASAVANGWELGAFPEPFGLGGQDVGEGTPSDTPFVPAPLTPPQLDPQPAIVPGRQEMAGSALPQPLRPTPLPSARSAGDVSQLLQPPPPPFTTFAPGDAPLEGFQPYNRPLDITGRGLPALTPPGRGAPLDALDRYYVWDPQQPTPLLPGAVEQWLAQEGDQPFTQPDPSPSLLAPPLAESPSQQFPPGPVPGMPLTPPPDAEIWTQRRAPQRRTTPVETSQGTAMPDQYQDELRRAAESSGVPADLLTALAQRENDQFFPKTQARAMDPGTFDRLLNDVIDRVETETGYRMTISKATRNRTAEEQMDLYEAGASQLDGTRGKESAHQKSLAADVYFQTPEGTLIDANTETGRKLYEAYGKIAEDAGLRWGGRWRMRDYGHVEAPPTGVGLWQVNPATAVGPGYDLDGDFRSIIENYLRTLEPQDRPLTVNEGGADYERAFAALLDPEVNAQIASRYLQALYAQTGNWEEALASYVMGPGAAAETNWRADNSIQDYVSDIMRNWQGPNVQLGLQRPRVN